MVAKEKHRETILKHISNPSNEIPDRTRLAIEVLGFKNSQQLYDYFTTDELYKIEAEGLDIRRTKYAPQLSRVDKALLTSAEEGDTAAAKLVYQRFEGWGETKKVSSEVVLKDMSDDELSSLIKNLISESDADSD